MQYIYMHTRKRPCLRKILSPIPLHVFFLLFTNNTDSMCVYHKEDDSFIFHYPDHLAQTNSYIHIVTHVVHFFLSLFLPIDCTLAVYINIYVFHVSG